MAEYSIELDEISKAYEKLGLKNKLTNLLALKGFRGERVTALDHVSLRVKHGEVFGLLGPNGAGKTTMIKILTTILTPDSGMARVDGFDVVTDSLKARQRIGVLYETGERGFGWRLTASTNLLFFAREYLADDPQKRVEEVLGLVELGSEDASKWFQKLSKGMKQKVALARALIPDSQVLFLDEPQRSLDILSVMRLKELIKEKFGKSGRTVFLSTHDMHLAEETCDRIAIINKGRIIKVGGIDEMKSTLGSTDTLIYTLEVAENPRDFNVLGNEILTIEGVEEAECQDSTKLRIHVRKDKAETLNRILSKVMDQGYFVKELTRAGFSLGDCIARALKEE